jgi:cysteine desulfurase / selenocysteine lyase
MPAPNLPAASPPPVLGSRALFPDLGSRVYLNHAGLSPAALPVRAAVTAVLDDLAARGAGAFLDWMEQRERLRARLATLVGAAPQDIALTGGTSRGLIDVSSCIEWRAGDRILGFAGEFPANVTPWQRAAESHGLRLELLPLEGFGDGSGDGLARVEAALRQGGVALVAASAVQFQTGLRMPIARLGALCRRHDALLSVDAIQAVGAVPMDMQAEQFDILATGTHKWLMSLDGFGFAAIGPRALARMQPRVAGWLSHEDPVRFLFEGPGELRYDRPIRERADFLEVGAWPTVGFAALEAAVCMLETLGIEAIHAHIQSWHDLIEPALQARGFESLRTAEPGGRSGLLCLRPPAHLHHAALHQGLEARGIACANPDAHLRLSPHWPNNEGEVPVVLDALDATIDALAPG